MSLYRRKSDGVEIATKEIRIFDSDRGDHSVESLEIRAFIGLQELLLECDSRIHWIVLTVL
jgi:hypothetical protein